MRTFEEIKSNIRLNKIATMERTMKKLENEGLKDWEEIAAKMVIQDCQSSINNLEEVTTIDIGATTNSLIRAIQKAYQLHLNDYWQNFERFVDEYIVGLTPDGNLKNGIYFGQGQCLTLGIGVNELLCFKGRDPMKAETVDLFRKIINVQYGTNIPMSGVEEQALRDYETVAFSDDVVAKDQAFMHLKEVQRDSGNLKNGGSYYTLATNQTYQEAKARSSGRII